MHGMRRGSVSEKAGEKLNERLAVLKGTRAQASKESPFNGKRKDEGGNQTDNGVLKVDGQLSSAKMNKKHPGNPSKGGRAGREEQPIYREHLDGEAKAPPFKGSPNMKGSASKMGAPSASRGKVAQTGPMYGGGGRNTQ